MVLREGRVTNYELTAVCQGRPHAPSFLTTPRPSATADGKLQGVFAAARDITEQKKLEAAAARLQAYNRGLIEASVDGLVTVDPARHHLRRQRADVAACAAITREELIGTPFADYFVDPERATAGVKETFQKGVVTDYVLTLPTRDGRQVRVSFNASVFSDARARCAAFSPRPATSPSRRGLQAQLARGARLQPRSDRGVARRPDHRRSHARHHRRQRDHVPHVGLLARGADRHSLRQLLHRSQERRRRACA